VRPLDAENRRLVVLILFRRLEEIDADEPECSQDARDQLVEGEQEVGRKRFVPRLMALDHSQARYRAQLRCDAALQVANLSAVEPM
jgi:hypothetical protein